MIWRRPWSRSCSPPDAALVPDRFHHPPGPQRRGPGGSVSGFEVVRPGWARLGPVGGGGCDDGSVTGASDEHPSDDLLPLIDKALATGRPLDLLGLASATLAIVVHPSQEQTVDDELRRDTVIQEMVQRYTDIGSSGSLAFAMALTALVPDETLRRRLR